MGQLRNIEVRIALGGRLLQYFLLTDLGMRVVNIDPSGEKPPWCTCPDWGRLNKKTTLENTKTCQHVRAILRVIAIFAPKKAVQPAQT